jgi:hypothetical protein
LYSKFLLSMQARPSSISYLKLVLMTIQFCLEADSDVWQCNLTLCKSHTLSEVRSVDMFLSAERNSFFLPSSFFSQGQEILAQRKLKKVLQGRSALSINIDAGLGALIKPFIPRIGFRVPLNHLIMVQQHSARLKYILWVWTSINLSMLFSAYSDEGYLVAVRSTKHFDAIICTHKP